MGLGALPLGVCRAQLHQGLFPALLWVPWVLQDSCGSDTTSLTGVPASACAAQPFGEKVKTRFRGSQGMD